MGRRIITIFIALLYQAEPVLCDSLLYQKDRTGSDKTFNPISYYFNLAFDTTQNRYYFTQKDFFDSHRVLYERVKNPARSIAENGGFGQFINEEFIGIRVLPNLALHVMGGGYDCRLLAEWYMERGVPVPYVAAFINSYLGNISNEAIETTSREVKATDNIADLFFFDIVGKFIFLNDSVVLFFRDTLKMHAWHFQPMFNIKRLHIENAGANYIFRPHLFGTVWRPFFHVGLTLQAGISYGRDGTDGDNYTVAFGVTPTDPINFKGTPIVALYWDRDDALLASITINGSSNLYTRINIYPGLITVWDLDIGLFASYSKERVFSLGLSIQSPIGVSI